MINKKTTTIMWNSKLTETCCLNSKKLGCKKSCGSLSYFLEKAAIKMLKEMHVNVDNILSYNEKKK